MSGTSYTPAQDTGRAGPDGYTIWSRVHVDEVDVPSVSPPGTRLGGAGTYAALGARLAAPRNPGVSVLSTLGSDFPPQFLAWFTKWAVDLFPGVAADAPTPRSRLVYRGDGERSETALLGPDHFDQFELWPGDIPEPFLKRRGLFVFRCADRYFWDAVIAAKSTGTTLLWEIDLRSCSPSCWPDVAGVLPDVDIFSINAGEAALLLGRDNREQCLETLRRSFSGVLLFRLGSQGSYVSAGDDLIRVTAATQAPVIDPTGAGNAYGGAFLVSYCQNGNDLQAAAKLASATAGLVVGCAGPLPDLNDDLRTELVDLAGSIDVTVLQRCVL